jgi:hypothetical protein
MADKIEGRQRPVEFVDFDGLPQCLGSGLTRDLEELDGHPSWSFRSAAITPLCRTHWVPRGPTARI